MTAANSLPTAAPGSPPKARKLGFTDRTVKLVAFRTGNRCAFPGCDERLIAPGTTADGPVILGELAHVRGERPGAARYDPSMTDAERQAPDNLVVLCRKHHRVIDAQPATYPVADLLKMRADHEQRVDRLFVSAVSRVGHQELLTIAKALIRDAGEGNGSLLVVPPAAKLAGNGLTARTASLLRLGLSKAADVTSFLDRMSALDPEFGERLRAGFVEAYQEFRADGLAGDDLFAELLAFAAQGNPDFSRQAAGLAVLSHLFEVCDVFEPVAA